MRGRDMDPLQHLNRPPGRQRRNDGVISPENGRPNEQRHISLGDIVKGVFGATPVGGAINAGINQGKANEANEEALGFARQDIQARQPFRDQLFASLQNRAQRPDLSNVFASQNPFASNLGPLNPQDPQAQAPLGGGLLGNTVRDFLANRGLGGLSAAELRARGVTGALVDGRGGRRSAPLRGGESAPFTEDEERFGGRFEGDF